MGHQRERATAVTGWRSAETKPAEPGMYEREWTNPHEDFWDGECWKFAHAGKATQFTALPNLRWRDS